MNWIFEHALDVGYILMQVQLVLSEFVGLVGWLQHLDGMSVSLIFYFFWFCWHKPHNIYNALEGRP